MGELIKVELQGEKESVNARELHDFLENKQDFSNWIKARINKFYFIENDDYVKCSPNLASGFNGGQNKIDYFVSIDMAKELSMVENNEKGRQARRYFIAREKQAVALSTPKTFAEALRLAADQQEELEAKEEQLKIQAPKVEFYDMVADSKTALSMNDVAKVLDCGMGRNKLFAFLRKKGVLQYNNIPYQKYIDLGYFRVFENTWEDSDGEIYIGATTRVYQKGVEFIGKLVKEYK